MNNVLIQARERLANTVLTPKQKYIYREIEIKNRTQREIAQELHITQPTVSRMLNSSRDKIDPLFRIIEQALNDFVFNQRCNSPPVAENNNLSTEEIQELLDRKE